MTTAEPHATPDGTAEITRRPRRALPKRLWWLVGALALPVASHLLLLAGTRMAPPPIDPPAATPVQASDDVGRREVGRSYARMRGKIREVRLVGDAVATGTAHVRLLREEQLAIESEMHQQFAQFVPWAAARLLIVDLARLRFRHLDAMMSPARRQEIAAQAAAFAPDPFAGMMGTYQRFVFLHSLYDIMLSFEHSPLIGCTSFVLGPEITAGGHTLVGRNFDFEGPQVLDDKKAVFLVHGDGPVPYATVSWPGFVGAATGMNAEGVAIVVHGARAGEAHGHGKPVAHTVRHLLANAHTTREAIAMLHGIPAMVPHMLLIADGEGDAAVVERVPGEQPFVRRRAGTTLPLTNHFEGPAAADPKNRQVIETSSTLARRSRLDELLANLAPGATVEHAVRILRDKRAAGDTELPLGHRSAIDALIATHSVVMDATARTLWVSEGPHATGRYLLFDLRELLDPNHEPRGPADITALPEDEIVLDGRWQAWNEAGRPHLGAE